MFSANSYASAEYIFSTPSDDILAMFFKPSFAEKRICVGVKIVNCWKLRQKLSHQISIQAYNNLSLRMAK